MIFPNRRAQPEMRPGMGYLPGSSALGYLPGSSALGYAPGRAAMGYVAHLGDFSAAMEQAAMADAANLGITQSDLDLLSSVGATDDDLTDLLNGNTTVAGLYAKYGVTFDSASASAAATGTTPAAQSPPGSTLLYTCSYNLIVGGHGSTDPTTLISDISSALPSHQMSKVSSAVQSSGIGISSPAFTMTVFDSIGHALISDAKSVLDGLVAQFTGAMPASSSLTLVSAGTTATGTPGSGTPGGNPQPQPTDLTAWFEDNAAYIGLGVLAVVAVNAFLSGGRRR